ncbi:MAG: peptide deformylase, partial [Ilumatobacteraceae bacterium]
MADVTALPGPRRRATSRRTDGPPAVPDPLDGGQDVTVRPIATVGHPVLRQRARKITPEELASDDVQTLIDDLIDTMHHANGAGIAANQVH